MAFSFETGTRRSNVSVGYENGELRLDVDGRIVAASLEAEQGAPGFFVLSCDGRNEKVALVRDGDRFWIHVRGESFEVVVQSALERIRSAARASSSSGVLEAPMPGVVVEVRASVGDRVEPGATLLVIESMKLQTRISAETGGLVAELPLVAGASFERGAVLARVEAVTSEVEAGCPEGGSK